MAKEVVSQEKGESSRFGMTVVIDMHATTLSQILGVQTSRKLDWSTDKEGDLQKAPTVWNKFDPKQMKKVGVSLSYVPSEEFEGRKIAMVLSALEEETIQDITLRVANGDRDVGQSVKEVIIGTLRQLDSDTFSQ
ncbi:OLC1v1024752C2 [Oldenlandia corymbosa var. corymbosa]|nr:OLC1v1024752C2 [Oldenlandia corymbosa var. corymbosa]